MKRIAWVLVLAMLTSMFAFAASAESADYAQSPLLDSAVADGTLPTVDDRLPDTPKLVHEVLDEDLEYEIGTFGGTFSLYTTSVAWSDYVFAGCNEALLSMSSINSGEILPNIVEDYAVNDDNTVFTFTLRKGLKWSDGAPVTMDDFMFAYNDYILNEELTPIISANMRSGGKSDGTPMVLEAVDDWTFTVTFDQPYGGFLVYLSIKGWSGYTDMLKPAHFLKQFHINYAEECHGSVEAYYEFIAPFAKVIGYDDPSAESVWTYVFNAIDMTNWEVSDPADALLTEQFAGLTDSNCPGLYPFIMKSDANGVTIYERNPYYFKVDEAGQQLPYFDYIECRYVDNDETAQIESLAGNYTFFSATSELVTMVLEGQIKGDYTVYQRPNHNCHAAIQLNATYGLNADGSVKDDDTSKAWQEVVNDIRFRQALCYAIDGDELNESECLGLGTVNPVYNLSHDIETANELLDEMGMLDIDGDGYRETPSGLKFDVQIWQSASYNVSTIELCSEYWREIGLKISGYATEGSLYSTSRDANEIPMSCALCHGSDLWHQLDWNFGECGVLWNNWVKAGGLTGKLEGSGEYLTPPDWYIELRREVERMMTETPDVTVAEVLPAVEQTVAEQLYTIIPLYARPCFLIIDSDVGNIAECRQFGVMMGMEYMFFHNPE